MAVAPLHKYTNELKKVICDHFKLSKPFALYGSYETISALPGLHGLIYTPMRHQRIQGYMV